MGRSLWGAGAYYRASAWFRSICFSSGDVFVPHDRMNVHPHPLASQLVQGANGAIVLVKP
jgi:hypothetical protein